MELHKNHQALRRSHKEDMERLNSEIDKIALKVLSLYHGKLSTPAQGSDRNTSPSPNQKTIVNDDTSAAFSGSSSSFEPAIKRRLRLTLNQLRRNIANTIPQRLLLHATIISKPVIKQNVQNTSKPKRKVALTLSTNSARQPMT